MSAERRRLVEAVFIEAAEVPKKDRVALVEARCADDPEARSEVLSLLEHHADQEDDSGFLDHAELTGVAGLGRLEAEGPPLKPGTRVAGFTIRELIGSGGMGMVYLADQDRPNRTVALKVIRLGARGLIRRFEHEAEVLGRLQHPGIAQVYEAGTANLLSAGGPAAQPYIAMEFVKGPPLDEYVSGAGLDLRARLELVAKVCDAAQHAHQRGVIHRDLKPANILVEAASGEPKVLDFGVARATGADARETRQTGAGQLIGTLAYMSPEQVLGDPSEVDTRADVYALGVILYELLTGRLPHRLEGTGLAESARIIREDEPVRPGTVVRSLRGEVETIITKALAKDRARRYQSAADLGLDLRRFLEGKPIAAKDDSALYILTKQIKRHKVLVAAALGFVIVLAWFAVYATIQSKKNQKSARAEERAKTEALESLKAAKDARTIADQTSERLKAELATSTVERGRLLALAGNLAAAEDLLWPAHLRDPDSKQTHWALWELYSHQPCLATVQAHQGAVMGLLLSPDESVMYSGAMDGIVRTWEPASARLTGEFANANAGVLDLAATSDGTLMGAALVDGHVIVWEVGERRERLRIAAHTGQVRAVAFSPDGTRIVSGGEDRMVRIWDARTGAPVAEMPRTFRTQLTRVTYSPDGAWIAASAAFSDGRVVVWDGADTVKEVTRHPGGAGPLAFSPDGNMLASAGWDRELRLSDPHNPRTIGTLLSPNGYVQSVRFVDGGKALISTGWWTVDTWDTGSMRRSRALSLRAVAPSVVAWRDGSRIAAGLNDGSVQFWDSYPSPGKIRLSGHAGRVAGSLNADGTIAATGDQDGVVRLWDTSDGSLLATIQAHKGRLKSLRFHQDGTLLATGAEDNMAHLWDLRTGALVGSVDRHISVSDDALNFSPDGRVMLVTRGNTVSMMRVSDLHPEGSTPTFPMQVVGARFSPDGRAIGVVTRDRILRICPLDGSPTRELTPAANVNPWCLAFSPDGKHMAVGDWNKDVQFWETSTWTQVGTFHGHSALIASVEFNPGDPLMVVSSALDGVVRLWDTRTGLTLATLDAFGGWDALSLSLSRDGLRVMATGATADAVIWDLQYFDRHIAWNAEHQIRRLAGAGDRVGKVRQWAASILERPARPAPEAIGVTPAVIRSWGVSPRQ